MKRRDEVAVGILLSVAAAILILGALWLARGGLSSGYPLYTRFAWGQNLKQGQPVLLAGVSVGYVADVKLKRDGYLDVVFRVDDDQQIPKGSTATVKPVGIFGDVAVALTPPLPVPAANYQPGDTVPPGPPTPDIAQIMSRVDSIGTSVQHLARAMEVDLVQAGALRDMRRTIANASALSAQLSAVAAEQNRNLTATLGAYRRAASGLDSAKLAATIGNLETTSGNTARLVANLDSSTTRLTGILGRIERGEGTAGKLVTDTLLYRDLRNLVGQTDSLLADLKKNPKKYINLSIF